MPSKNTLPDFVLVSNQVVVQNPMKNHQWDLDGPDRLLNKKNDQIKFVSYRKLGFMDTEEVKKERKKAIRILLDKWVKNYDFKSKALLIKKIPWQIRKGA